MQDENRRTVLPRTPPTSRTAVAFGGGLTFSMHRRTRRFASTGRPCLPGEHRRPPFCKRACSMESCLPAGVRLRLCARVPLPGSPFVLCYGEGRHLPSPSRQIKAEQWDAVQACLDKQPTAKAALGRSPKARRSRGSGGGATTMTNTRDPAPALAGLAGFAANNKNASQEGRLCDCPALSENRGVGPRASVFWSGKDCWSRRCRAHRRCSRTQSRAEESRSKPDPVFRQSLVGPKLDPFRGFGRIRAGAQPCHQANEVAGGTQRWIAEDAHAGQHDGPDQQHAGGSGH